MIKYLQLCSCCRSFASHVKDCKKKLSLSLPIATEKHQVGFNLEVSTLGDVTKHNDWGGFQMITRPIVKHYSIITVKLEGILGLHRNSLNSHDNCMTALVLAKNNYFVYHAFIQILPVYVNVSVQYNAWLTEHIIPLLLIDVCFNATIFFYFFADTDGTPASMKI